PRRDDVAADAERHNPPFQRIEMQADVSAKSGAGKLLELQEPAVRQQLIARERRERCVHIDDDERNAWGRALGARRSGDAQEASQDARSRKRSHGRFIVRSRAWTPKYSTTCSCSACRSAKRSCARSSSMSF